MLSCLGTAIYLLDIDISNWQGREGGREVGMYRLQYPDWTAFKLMLSSLGTAIYLLDVYRQLACMN